MSGGPDSSALLLALVRLGVEVRAAHFDHALRPGSAADAEHVAWLCGRLQIPLITGRREQELPPGSLQAAARSLRYAFLADAQERSGAACVLLAHTADDLVEGAVLHLLRGSSLAGLRGMPRQRGPYRRPLLEVWRHQVEALLAEADLPALSDPSNRDLRHRRAWVRHWLLPQLEADRPGISRRFHAAALQAGRLHDLLDAAAASLVDGRRDRIQAAAQPVRLEAYRQMYAAAGGPQPGLNRRQLETIDGLVTAGRTGASLDLPHGLRFHVGCDRVWVAPPSSPSPFEPKLLITQCTGCAEPDAVHLDAGLAPSLRWGHRRPGLRIRPAGSWGTRKLQDILVDARVPRTERDSLPLLFAGDRLAWVPGLAVEADFVPVPGRPVVHVSLEEPFKPHARIPKIRS